MKKLLSDFQKIAISTSRESWDELLNITNQTEMQ